MFILFAERKVGEQHGPAAQGVLAAVQTLREMNADNLRKVPADAPTAFIKPRWKPLVITPEGLDRKFYEICALSELKNALRSGDIWVKGSRQFRDFDDYRKRLVRTVLIFTESSDQLSRATDRVPGLPASPGYVQ